MKRVIVIIAVVIAVFLLVGMNANADEASSTWYVSPSNTPGSGQTPNTGEPSHGPTPNVSSSPMPTGSPEPTPIEMPVIVWPPTTSPEPTPIEMPVIIVDEPTQSARPTPTEEPVNDKPEEVLADTGISMSTPAMGGILALAGVGIIVGRRLWINYI